MRAGLENLRSPLDPLKIEAALLITFFEERISQAIDLKAKQPQKFTESLCKKQGRYDF
jgi:hypothetical protein